ncbi:MAG: metallophosphoesterase family protein [Vulcanimicrobiaceae bacterium]
MVRFLHSADWHVGLPAHGLGAAAEVVREERFAALERIVALARASGCEFALVAGDIFDHVDVPAEDVRRLARLLACFEGLVYLVPGHADPASASALWNDDESWSAAPNVVRVRNAAPVCVRPGVTLYPCPVAQPGTADPNLQPPPERNGIAIGIAHALFAGREPAAEGFDYLALGGRHGTHAFFDARDQARAWYSGTPEPASFDDIRPGNALVVEIDDAGATPFVQARSTGRLRWRVREVEVSCASEIDGIARELATFPNRETTLMQLILNGVVTADAAEAHNRLERLGAPESGFLFFEIDERDFDFASESEVWIAEFPDGPLQASARAILDSTGGDLGAARRAFRLLYGDAPGIR